MALKTLTISADTSGTFLASVHRRRDAPHYLATCLIYGGGGNNFGSGTVSLHLSPDGGTTLIPINDLSGNPVATTGNLSLPKIELGNPSTNTDTLKIYVVVSGSTSPTIKINWYDNN